METSYPKSLSDCLDGKGGIIIEKWFLYKRRQRRILEQEEEEEEEAARQKKQRSLLHQELVEKFSVYRSCFRKNLNLGRNTDGSLYAISPESSSWYISYISSPDVSNSKFQNKFQRRFRCQYDSYLLLLSMVQQDNDFFNRWKRKDAVGRSPSPIELLLLGSLRYLGRGWTFDDLEESTSISEEVHRVFFHSFIKWGSTVLFNEYVTYPKEPGEELSKHCKELEMCGLYGCVGSMDATHVTMTKCPVSRSNEHMGCKESLPSRSYNICVNHKRQILHTTRGHPSRWNDKSIVFFDEFVMKIKNGQILSNNEFELLEKDALGNITTKKYKGAWILCDNGYQNWSTLMAPMKDALTYKQFRWSKWLESVRKDVECTFGILKGRFRILKIGMRVQSIEATDQIWCTCCALHNLFLDKDGLCENWEAGSISDWLGELSNHCPNDIIDVEFDLSCMGFGNDSTITSNYSTSDCDTDIETIVAEFDDTIEVRKMNHKVFREKLINNFDILFFQNKISWPKRNGDNEPEL